MLYFPFTFWNIYHNIGIYNFWKIFLNTISEVSVGKWSAAVSFQIGFKRVGFFFWWKRNCCFNFPRFEFWSMRNFSGVVFGKTSVQIFRNSRIPMSSSYDINEQVHIIKFWHINNFCAFLYYPLFTIPLYAVARLRVASQLYAAAGFTSAYANFRSGLR